MCPWPPAEYKPIAAEVTNKLPLKSPAVPLPIATSPAWFKRDMPVSEKGITWLMLSVPVRPLHALAAVTEILPPTVENVALALLTKLGLEITDPLTFIEL